MRVDIDRSIFDSFVRRVRRAARHVLMESDRLVYTTTDNSRRSFRVLDNAVVVRFAGSPGAFYSGTIYFEPRAKMAQ